MNDDHKNDIIAATTAGGLLGLNKLLHKDSVRDYLENKFREGEFDDKLSRKLGDKLEEYNKFFRGMVPSDRILPITLSSGDSSYLIALTDQDHNFIPNHINNKINIRVKTDNLDPVGLQGLRKPVNLATLAHEIGHYKTYLKDKKSILLKLDALSKRVRRPNNMVGLGVGGGLYSGAKALGASDETALTASAVGGGLTGLAHDAPVLTNEALASLYGLKGIIDYNKTTTNKLPLKNAVSSLARAYATYLRRPLANTAKMAGLGLAAGGFINLYKNLLHKD